MNKILSHFKKQSKEVIKNIFCITFISNSNQNNNQFFNLLVIAFSLDEAIPLAKATAVEKLGAVENTLIFKAYLVLAGDEVLKNILDLEFKMEGKDAEEATKIMKELIKNKDKDAVERAPLSEAQKKYVLGEIDEK